MKIFTQLKLKNQILIMVCTLAMMTIVTYGHTPLTEDRCAQQKIMHVKLNMPPALSVSLENMEYLLPHLKKYDLMCLNQRHYEEKRAQQMERARTQEQHRQKQRREPSLIHQAKKLEGSSERYLASAQNLRKKQEKQAEQSRQQMQGLKSNVQQKWQQLKGNVRNVYEKAKTKVKGVFSTGNKPTS